MCLDSGLRASSGCSNTTSALAYSGDVNVDYCNKHTSVSWCSSGNGAANEFCTKMGATTSSKTLTKLSGDEVRAIRDAMSCGLSGGYPSEDRVYYTGGSWHGYSGNRQPNVSEHYLVCTVHNAESYAASLVPEPEPETETVPGGGAPAETPTAPAAANHKH